MSSKPRKRRRAKEYADGLGRGFAKALKIGVNASIAARKLQAPRTPAWWRPLP